MNENFETKIEQMNNEQAGKCAKCGKCGPCAKCLGVGIAILAVIILGVVLGVKYL